MKKRLKLSMLFSARQREPAREPPGKPAGSGFVQVVGDPFNIYRAFAQAALQHAARGGRVVFASGVEAASDELHQATVRGRQTEAARQILVVEPLSPEFKAWIVETASTWFGNPGFKVPHPELPSWVLAHWARRHEADLVLLVFPEDLPWSAEALKVMAEALPAAVVLGSSKPLVEEPHIPLEAVRGVEDLLRPPEGAFPKPSSPL